MNSKFFGLLVVVVIFFSSAESMLRQKALNRIEELRRDKKHCLMRLIPPVTKRDLTEVCYHCKWVRSLKK